MRALVLAAVCVVALIAGSAVWLTRGDVEAGTSQPVAGVEFATRAGPPPDLPAPVQVMPSLPRVEAPARPEPLVANPTPVAAPGAMTDGVGLLLFGAVRTADGEPVDEEDAWVALRGPDARERYAPLFDGTYSAAGLIPGRWTLVLDVDGYRSLQAVVELSPAQPMTRCDLLLVPTVELCVRLTTPSGAAFVPEAGGPDLDGALSVVVTSDRPPRTLPAEGNISLRAVGLGGVSTILDLAAAANGADCAGSVVVATDLPVFVSLALHQLVLATERVLPGATEVVFVIRSENLPRVFGALHVTVVDAAGGQPVSNARVGLSDGDNGSRNATVDARGTVVMSDCAPGQYYLDVSAPGHGRLSQLVDLEPGDPLALTVALDPATRIRGVLADGDGAPVSATITVVPLAQAGEDWWTFRRKEWQSDGEGAFEIGPLGRERFVLLVVDSDCASRPVVVDTRSGDVDGVQLLAATPVKMELDADWPDDVSHRVTIFDAAGAPVRSYDWRGGRHGPMPLAPGRYEVQVDRRTPQVFDAAGDQMLVTLRP